MNFLLLVVDYNILPTRLLSSQLDNSKGIIANFKEVLSPYSFREEAIQRYRISLSNRRESTNEREGKPKTI
jgi:hypothetical protein